MAKTYEDDLDDLFEDDKTERQAIPQDDKAQMLANMADYYTDMEREIELMEGKLAIMNERFRRLREDLIPEKMIELGIKKIVLTDGSTLSYGDFYAGKVKDEAGYDWLEQNGYADAVKTELKLEASRVDKKIIDMVKEFLSRQVGYQNYSAKEKQSIHHMTLGAAIKSLTKQGKELPQDLFETFIGKRATLKRK